ncbi:MAG: hypothetical protein A3C90_02375 [Candidatus Magasanikbacteria bacterium RIFCSPHIGHO2_02_FULL_51_14]|uniref:Uncharacterized protein n=1 Tax=Candidatus Magasanikbacteria bacterium RIFCSPHIGHO2_02_FULL_51_14 TaxID=1798683 RepID=A0A1F6MQ61_9BACT|nr:MAG: hypothetical protein A3C90_02375 [Candidatus Magasanikbacteria bacterium RIFCSPHIGHO2_02_FULL_51_14]
MLRNRQCEEKQLDIEILNYPQDEEKSLYPALAPQKKLPFSFGAGFCEGTEICLLLPPVGLKQADFCVHGGYSVRAYLEGCLAK